MVAPTRRPELAGIPAVVRDDVLVLPFRCTGPGPVAVEGLEVMSRQLAEVGTR